MRTNGDIGDALIERVMADTGLPTKRAAVDAGLRALLRLDQQKEILGLAGAVRWEGDLDAVREGPAKGRDRRGQLGLDRPSQRSPYAPGAAPARAAANYRFLRSCGITVRKTAGLIIGTFCIERGHGLLHDDRDFLPMAAHLGLKVVLAAAPPRIGSRPERP